jgi:fatty-acyl-CoA synthase
VRPGDCLAFSVPWPEGEERVVMVVQSRQNDPAERADLVKRLQGLVRSEFGIECHVELVPPQTLPRTSSGKLSRSKARQNFMASRDLQAVEPAAGASRPAAEGTAVARRVA